MKKNKQAFTLVELIVVITILAILGTIAFITLQGYSAQARDSKRLSDIQNIKKSLELFSLNTGNYPLPDNGEEVEYEGDLVWTQGIVGEKVIKNLSKNLNELPLDPKTELEYTYSLINSGNKYEVLSIYESDLVSQNKLINSSFASSNYMKVDGTYNGIFVKTSNYYIPTPSLITSEDISSGLTLNGENIKSQIITGGNNRISIGLSESSTGELNIKLVTYTGCITDKSEDSEKQKLAEIIQEAYTGSSLASKGVYKKILEITETSKLIDLVDNVVLNNVSNISNFNSINKKIIKLSSSNFIHTNTFLNLDKIELNSTPQFSGSYNTRWGNNSSDNLLYNSNIINDNSDRDNFYIGVLSGASTTKAFCLAKGWNDFSSGTIGQNKAYGFHSNNWSFAAYATNNSVYLTIQCKKNLYSTSGNIVQTDEIITTSNYNTLFLNYIENLNGGIIKPILIINGIEKDLVNKTLSGSFPAGTSIKVKFYFTGSSSITTQLSNNIELILNN